MKTPAEKVSIGDFARQIRDQMIPAGNRFSYFVVALQLSDEDIREYLDEPIASLPPKLRALIPEVRILLTPFLESGPAKCQAENHAEDLVCFEKPAAKRQIWSSRLAAGQDNVLAFALKDQDVADYHYRFFRELAVLAAGAVGSGVHDKFSDIVREELSAGTHGEVDEQSWQLKQALLRRQRNVRRKTKGFAAYARQAFIDTTALYLHGICCDIDVDPGPRQLASRHIRRRLELLRALFPPPEGYAVFPEELNHAEETPPAS